jgi:hypothetical protein
MAQKEFMRRPFVAAAILAAGEEASSLRVAKERQDVASPADRMPAAADAQMG